MNEKHYDLLIIGGGVGGYSVALRAREYGKSVAIIEANEIGGTCLNRGCIPTKTFLHIAEEIRNRFLLDKNPKMRNDEMDFPVDLEERIREKVTVLRSGLSNTLKVAGIDIFQGKALASGENTINVVKPDPLDNSDSNAYQPIRYGNLIIATGSKPLVPDGFLLGESIFTTDDAFLACNMGFNSIAIIGGGVIGTEFASIYADLGKEVTIIEPQKGLISGFSKELSGFVRVHLQRKGVKIKTSTSVIQISEEDGEVYIELSKDGVKEEILCDKSLICTGRCANIDDRLVSDLGISIFDGLIKVDQNNMTSNSVVYAVGDVCNPIQLAYTASKTGENVADYLYGQVVVNSGDIPKCIYMDVEVAQVGTIIDLDENDEFITEKYSLKSNGRAVLEGRTHGFIRMTVEKKSGVLAGVEMAAPNAVDSIQLCKLLVDKRITVSEIAEMIYPHPSYIEAIKDSARLVIRKMQR